jgi:hypothetical protein
MRRVNARAVDDVPDDFPVHAHGSHHFFDDGSRRSERVEGFLFGIHMSVSFQRKLIT